MRPRAKKHLEERLARCESITVLEPTEMKGKWKNGDRPLHLEIGCGKGNFVLGMAQNHPEIDFVAVELVRDVIVMAMEKVMAAEVPNIRFISCDAKILTEIFAPGEVDRVYLNFSDPWKKSRQHKRRLTFPTFLKIYEEIMGGHGEIHQKTDNRDLFDASLEYFKSENWALRNVTFDLHGDGAPVDSVITEYESRFMELGQPIHRVEAYK